MATAPKVILLSLDGNTYSLLKNYLDTNQLDPTKGLGLLRNKGIFLPNTTITPSLTAPSHIAIATGSTAANNDINANSFHLVDSPFNFNISGFGAPIGGYDALNPDGPRESGNPTAKPLWDSILAAGKTVVAATFPGADGVDVKVPGLTNSPVIQSKTERTVNYTIPFGAFGGVGGRGFSLTANNFTVDPTQATNGLTALGKTSYSSVKVANLETIQGTALTGGSSKTNYNLQVAAIDTTNDSTTNYDTLVVFDANAGIQGATNLPSTGSAFIKASDKKSSPFYFEGSNNKVGAAFYASTLAPDLSTVNIARYSGNYIPRPAESPAVVANVDDINNNIGFWAPQADFRFPERLNSGLTNFSDAELEAIYEDQVKTFVDYQTKVFLRSIQQNPNADLALGYIEQPDGSEHQFLLTDPRQATDFTNPNSIGAGQDQAKIQRYKDYTLAAYKAANDVVQKVIDTVGVDANGVPNSDIIIVSDHGFAPFHTAVSINNLLKNSGDADLSDTTKVRAVSSGPAVNIYISVKGREPNGTVDPSNYVAIQQKITNLLQNFKDTNSNYTNGAANVSVFDKVYSRPVPANPSANDIINGKSDFIGQDSGDVFALLSLGYNFDGTQSTPVKRLGDDQTATTPVFSVPNFYGAHGYDPTLPQMQAIFAAAGPDFNPSTITQKSINNIDVAPTIQKILGVAPASTVQGTALQGIQPTLPKLTFIGQATYPAQSVTVKDANGNDTLVGGLSGITYDAKNNVFYSISDDRKSNANEPGQPTRFYTVKLDLSSGSLDNSKVSFQNVTFLKKSDGTNYTPQSTDTEDIGLTNNGTVFISSEGQVDASGQIRVNPFVNEYNLSTGQLLRTLPIPTKFLPDTNLAATETRGTYDNLAFESVAISPDKRTLLTGTENALIQDGQRTSFPGSDSLNPSGIGRARLLKFNLDTNQAVGEYLYNVDPTAVAPSKTPGGVDNFTTAGLVALTALDNNGNYLAIERSFSSVSATTPNTPETSNVIKIYRISIGDATDISSINSLKAISDADFAKIKPVQKQLLLNLDDLKLSTGLDNIEGVTFGPMVNGKPTIVLVADDNFNKTPAANTTNNTFNQSQFTQIVALTVDFSGAFPNGVASGDTTQTSTVLWTRTPILGKVTFEYSTSADFSTIIGTKTATANNALQPVKVSVDGLNPNTNYFYRVTDALGDRVTGKFSTAAALGTKTGLTFGVSGDWRGELSPYPSISNADTENLKFFVEFGDTIYGDVASPALKNSDGTEKQQAITIDDYRTKYSEVYGSRYGQNTFADLRASTSIIATLDDHEVTNDFAGGAPISSDKGGTNGANRFLAAYPTDDPNAIISDSTLYKNGTQAFQEYKPIQDQFYGTTGDARTGGKRKIYRYNTFGKDAATFVLDARSFRDTELADVTNLSDQTQVSTFLAKSFDPTRTMLGKQQVQDLKNDLLNAQNNGVLWKFIMVPEPIENLGVLAASDRFEGYAAERTEILKFINDNKIGNVVFVSADIHGTLVNNLTYQTAPGQAQIATSAFEVVTGPVAYDKPFGPTVAELALAAGLITAQQKTTYDALPNAGKDAFIKNIVNGGLTPFGYDPVGLDNNLTQANGLINAKLLQGDYVATNTYGWTEFNIDPTTQKLTVTTWGTDAYSRAQLEANPSAITALQPKIVSQFEVTPNIDKKLFKVSDDVFSISANNSGEAKLKVSFTKLTRNLVSELGVFAVDDASGSIGGLLPTDAGYIKAALAKSKVVSSAITNLPNGYNPTVNDLTRLLQFAPDQNLRFYLLKNNTTSDELNRNGISSDLQFSSVQKVSDIGANGFSLDFNDLAINVQTSADALTLGTALQGATGGEVIDLRGVAGTVKADFTVNREAAYNDFVGFYKVDDETGRIGTIQTTDLGYAQAAMKARVSGVVDLQVANQGTASFTGNQFTGGAIYAPFLIVNGTVDQVLSGQTNQVYFNYVGANPDKVDHVRLLGNNTFGFEDLFGGGDRDYNDIIVQAKLTV